MEKYAVTGYLPDQVAHALKPKHAGAIEVLPERGSHDVLMRVQGQDIAEVRTGSSSDGHTMVQLILRDGAPVETVVRSTADAKGLTRFNDPAIGRLTASATAKVIAV
jgi:hypothetical protein